MSEQDEEVKVRHVAESKWQTCMCEHYQAARKRIEDAPGKPIDFATYRHKDEKY